MALFAPRPPMPFKEPIVKRKMYPYTGVAVISHNISLKNTAHTQNADFVKNLKEYDMPPPEKKETPQERRKKRKTKLDDRHGKRLKLQKDKWDPKHPENPDMTKVVHNH
eukprot:1385167-Amorphochlora_amoeboformis.AAC.3